MPVEFAILLNYPSFSFSCFLFLFAIKPHGETTNELLGFYIAKRIAFTKLYFKFLKFTVPTKE